MSKRTVEVELSTSGLGPDGKPQRVPLFVGGDGAVAVAPPWRRERDPGRQAPGGVGEAEQQRRLRVQDPVDLAEHPAQVGHAGQFQHRQHDVDRVGPDRGQFREVALVHLERQTGIGAVAPGGGEQGCIRFEADHLGPGPRHLDDDVPSTRSEQHHASAGEWTEQPNGPLVGPARPVPHDVVAHGWGRHPGRDRRPIVRRSAGSARVCRVARCHDRDDTASPFARRRSPVRPGTL